ncbi:neuronal acetylcholine receptor subunit alpha-5-like, partial [Saccoglossus kowalevskii]|uniref:Neuronal acetylcholine receptor subunit alpha-5-like n=1 Tax=Saccoglossus kowalevskii TaxID=10224 RepID=A0ABM0MST5_SACKO
DIKNNKALLSVCRKLSWIDPRLEWNREQYPGIDILRINMDDIWVPDIVLYNGKQTQTHKAMGILYPDGMIFYLPPYEEKVMCNFGSAFWFPYDTHKITIKYGSWAYDGTAVDLGEIQIDIESIFGKMQSGN